MDGIGSFHQGFQVSSSAKVVVQQQGLVPQESILPEPDDIPMLTDNIFQDMYFSGLSMANLIIIGLLESKELPSLDISGKIDSSLSPLT